MRHSIRCIVLASLTAGVLAAADTKPIRVLVVTGGHLHEASFYEMFTRRTNLRVEMDGHPSVFRRDLTKTTDVLVLYDLAEVTEEPRRKILRAFVEGGGGLVLLHHSIADNQQWQWWYEEVVGGRYLLHADNGMSRSTFQHDVDLTVSPAGDHPITRGIAPFKIRDECYKGLWVSPKVEVLLRTSDERNDPQVGWIGPHENARVVYLQLGHGSESHLHPAYRKLVDNAIRWAARRLN